MYFRRRIRRRPRRWARRRPGCVLISILDPSFRFLTNAFLYLQVVSTPRDVAPPLTTRWYHNTIQDDDRSFQFFSICLRSTGKSGASAEGWNHVQSSESVGSAHRTPVFFSREKRPANFSLSGRQNLIFRFLQSVSWSTCVRGERCRPSLVTR